MVDNAIRVGDEVARALDSGSAVVALESTIIAHGLPSPRNVDVAAQIEQTVRDHGAVPATIGMIGGTVVIGLNEAQVRHLGTSDGVAKLSVRDLAAAATKGSDGATTVASTAALAARAGIKVFATGGLGGVHRGASDSYDESADLTALSRTQILVVCAGVKSILDVGATLERLETLGVTVIGYGSRRFAGWRNAAAFAKANLGCADEINAGTPGSARLAAAASDEITHDALQACASSRAFAVSTKARAPASADSTLDTNSITTSPSPVNGLARNSANSATVFPFFESAASSIKLFLASGIELRRTLSDRAASGNRRPRVRPIASRGGPMCPPGFASRADTWVRPYTATDARFLEP